jgi:hypothetical protein
MGGRRSAVSTNWRRGSRRSIFVSSATSSRTRRSLRCDGFAASESSSRYAGVSFRTGGCWERHRPIPLRSERMLIRSGPYRFFVLRSSASIVSFPPPVTTNGKRRPTTGSSCTPDSGSVLSIAGLWDEWRHPDTKQVMRSCTMMIKTPDEGGGVLHDGVPVILEPGQFEPWLSGEAGAIVEGYAAQVPAMKRQAQ